MKYLIATLFFLCPQLLSAQEITKEIIQFMKTDDAAAFEKYIIAGNDIDQCIALDKSTYTYLTLAIKGNRKNIFAKCIALEADLEQICTDKTPLMYTIKYDRYAMFAALLNAGVDQNQKSGRGKTALEYAKKYDRPELAKLLE